MKQFFILFLLYIKRFIYKISFLILLFIIPLVAFILNYFSLSDNDGIDIGLLWNINDTISNKACIELIEQKGYIKFIKFENEEKLINDVKGQKIECGYSFDNNFTIKLNEKKFNNSIKCYDSPSAFISKITDEIVFSYIIKNYGENITSNFEEINDIFDKNKSILENKENVYSKYNKYFNNGSTFSFEYKRIDSTIDLNTEEKENILFVFRGIMSVFILISGLLGCIMWLDDKNNSVFTAFDFKMKFIISIVSILSPVLLSSISALLSIYFSKISIGFMKELYFMLLYAVSITGFSIIIKNIFKSSNSVCAFFPILVIGCLVFCPIFINISLYFPVFMKISRLFLPYYYLNSITGGINLLNFAVISFSIFILSLIVEIYKDLK